MLSTDSTGCVIGCDSCKLKPPCNGVLQKHQTKNDFNAWSSPPLMLEMHNVHRRDPSKWHRTLANREEMRRSGSTSRCFNLFFNRGGKLGKNSKKTVIRIQVDPVVHATSAIVESQPLTPEGSEAVVQPEKNRRFPTTRWTVVRRVVSEEGTESTEALEWLYRAYWPPLFTTVLRMGFKFHEAEDLTQGYLMKIIQNSSWSAADPAKGTLRSYLCTGLRRYVFDELDRRSRQSTSYLEEAPEVAMDQKFETRFDHAWALQLYQRAQRTLVLNLSRSVDFPVSQVLFRKLLEAGGGPTHAEIATLHGLTEDAVKMRAMRLRKQWHRVLRDEVAKTVSLPDEIDQELRHLIAVLSSN